MMYAGLEQYVYERLGQPDIEVAAPVANPITSFDAVDWISEDTGDGEDQAIGADAPRLLLLGSCDLTAVASYCSANRAEYVNGVKHGIMTRCDDFGFILGAPEAVRASATLPALPAWDAEEFGRFHRDLPESEIVIVSLFAALKGHHLVTGDGVVVRIHPEALGHAIDYDPAAAWLRGTSFYKLTMEQKLDLLERSIAFMDVKARAARHKFLLGANTRDSADTPMRAADRLLAERYNAACEAICASRPAWKFLSIDAVVSPDKLIDDRHYTRTGYLDIANHLNARMQEPTCGDAAFDITAARDDSTLVDLMRRGQRVSRLTIFGNRPTSQFASIKQAIKLVPFASILRQPRI